MKINLIPAAGAGKRFMDEGYVFPKPLISVDGVPMVVAAAWTLPDADKWIFLVRREHVDEHYIDDVLKTYFPGAEIVIVEKLTEGQASTCLLAEDLIDAEAELTIGACDNGMIYDLNKFRLAMDDSETDALAWTFRNNPTVQSNPNAYGWVIMDHQNRMTGMSVKKAISDNPIRDHAIVGTFSFKKAKYFFDGAHRMIAANRRINNEFYIDECMAVLVENGLRVKVFEEDYFLCWGTPRDLKLYEYWRDYFFYQKFYQKIR